MKAAHLLRVEEGPEAFADLVVAARALGLRVGWLGWTERPVLNEAPEPLASAAASGALRAVTVGPDGAVAVKPRSGPPVLRDVLREHFLGCRAVLVRGFEGEGLEAPQLHRDGDGYRLGDRALSALELAEWLRGARSMQ